MHDDISPRSSNQKKTRRTSSLAPTMQDYVRPALTKPVFQPFAGILGG
jgi:hypothetical protein